VTLLLCLGVTLSLCGYISAIYKVNYVIITNINASCASPSSRNAGDNAIVSAICILSPPKSYSPAVFELFVFRNFLVVSYLRNKQCYLIAIALPHRLFKNCRRTLAKFSLKPDRAIKLYPVCGYAQRSGWRLVAIAVIWQAIPFLNSKPRESTLRARITDHTIFGEHKCTAVFAEIDIAVCSGLETCAVVLRKRHDVTDVCITKTVKYLNNIIEQDHRFVKRVTGPMLGFKAFHSAEATLAGIETAHMIRKGQLDANGLTAFQQFAELAA